MSTPALMIDEPEIYTKDSQEILELFQVYVLEVSPESRIETVHFTPSQRIPESEQWAPGVFLNILYKDFPVFLHFMNQAIRGKRIESSITLFDQVFDSRFVPMENGNVSIYLKRVIDARQKTFGGLASEKLFEELNVEEPKTVTEDTKDGISAELLHERLKVSDRMATLGMQLSGVAHEMNNPIGFIIII